MGRLASGRLMRRAAALLAFLIVALAAQEQETVFRVDVRLVRILATVKNTVGDLIGTLEKGDFTVLDNAVPQELAVFERQTEQPLSIALLIDTSLSVAKDLDYELESVRRFFQAFFREGNPDDALALYTFSYDINLLNSFTRRQARLEASLKQIRPDSGTSLYDAIFVAAGDLEARDGRHVILLVTDGGNTTSVRTFHEALEAAQLADAVVYSVLVMPIPSDVGRNIGGEHALATMAAGTGGRVFHPALGAALDQAFTDILRDLRTQYLLGYYPKNVPPSKDRFHRLEIRLRRPDLRVSARNGYYEEFKAERSGWKPAR